MGTKIFEAALWSYADSAYLTVGQFVLGVVLARLLSPDEFGLFIAVTAFTSLLLMAAQFGLPQAVLQASALADDTIDSVFWFTACLAVAGFAIAVMVAPSLGRLYREDEFRTVFVWMGATLLLMPYTAIGLAVMRRQMRFAEVARMNVLAFSVSAVLAVGAAVAGAGVYSLVLSAFASMCVNTISIARRLRWRPRLAGLRGARPLLGYARVVTVNNALSVSGSRVDNMLVGGLLGTGPLGLYNRAYSLARIPSDQFADSLAPLLLGALARMQEDVDRSRALFFKAVAAVALLTAPFLVALAVTGPAAIAVLYGDAWTGAGVPLQVMVIGAALLVPTWALRGLMNAQGMVAQLVPVNLWALLVTVVAVTAFAPLGLVGIAVGISLREGLVLLLLLRVARQSRLDIRAGEVVHALVPASSAAVVGGVGGGAALMLLHQHGMASDLLQVLAGGIGVFVAYGCTVLILMKSWRSHEPLAATTALARELFGKLRRHSG